MSFTRGHIQRALLALEVTPTAQGPGDSCTVQLCFRISAGFKHQVGDWDKAGVFLALVLMLRKHLRKQP